MMAYTALVGVAAMGATTPGDSAKGCAGTNILRVKAGDPSNSLLLQKVTGKQTCGNSMPPGGMLLPEEQATISAWIMAGAKND
jgi:hypothetical protein